MLKWILVLTLAAALAGLAGAAAAEEAGSGSGCELFLNIWPNSSGLAGQDMPFEASCSDDSLPFYASVYRRQDGAEPVLVHRFTVYDGSTYQMAVPGSCLTEAGRYTLMLSLDQDAAFAAEGTDACDFSIFTEVLPAPTLSVVHGETNGTDITVTAHWEAGVERWLECYLIHENGLVEEIYWTDSCNQNTIWQLSGPFTQEAGTYEIRAYSFEHDPTESDDYSTATGIAVERFTLAQTQLPQAPEAVYDETVDFGEPIVITVPGAEEVMYSFAGYDEVTGEEIGETGLSSPKAGDQIELSNPEAARYVITYYAKIGGLWSKNGKITVTVIPLGTLNQPTVTCQGQAVDGVLNLAEFDDPMLQLHQADGEAFSWVLMDQNKEWCNNGFLEGQDAELDLAALLSEAGLTVADLGSDSYTLRISSLKTGYQSSSTSITLVYDESHLFLAFWPNSSGLAGQDMPFEASCSDESLPFYASVYRRQDGAEPVLVHRFTVYDGSTYQMAVPGSCLTEAGRYTLMLSLDQDAAFAAEGTVACDFSIFTEVLPAPTLSVVHGETNGTDITVTAHWEAGVAGWLECYLIHENGLTEEINYLSGYNQNIIWRLSGPFTQEAGTYEIRGYSFEHSPDESDDYSTATGVTAERFTLSRIELPEAPDAVYDETVDFGDPIVITVPGTEEVMYVFSMFDSATGEEIGGSAWDSPVQGDRIQLTKPEPARYVFSYAAKLNGIWSKLREGEVTVTVLLPASVPVPEVIWSSTEGLYGETVYATVTTADVDALEMELDGFGVQRFRTDGSVTRIPLTLNWADAQTVRFRCMLRGVYSDWSTGTKINATYDCPDPPADWQPIAPESIVPGQDVVVCHIPVNGAVSYNVGVWDGNGILIYEAPDTVQPGEVVLPAAVFADGGTFHIGMGVSNGLSGDWCWKDIPYVDVPACSTGEAPSLSAAAASCPYGSPAVLTLSMADAEQVMIQEKETLQFGSEVSESWYTTALLQSPGQTFSVELQPSQTDHTLRASVRLNGVWSSWSNPVAIRVEDPLGELTGPKITGPRTAYADQPLTVTWYGMSDAESYRLELRPACLSWYSDPLYAVSTDQLRHTFAAGEIPAGEYQILVYSVAEGYRCSPDSLTAALLTVLPAEDTPVETLTLPAGLTEIGAEAFSGVKANQVIIPASCQSIGSRAFANSGLTDITIPASVTEIGSSVFAGCGLVTVHAPEHSAAAEYALSHGYPLVTDD